MPASAFATIVVERLLDLVTVLLLFGSAIRFSGVDVGTVVERAGTVVAIVAIGGVVVLFILAGHPERLVSLADRVSTAPAAGPRADRRAARADAGRWPPRHAESLASGAGDGLVVALWLSIALGIVFTSWAFGLELSLVGSFLVLGYLTVGVAAPTPGAAGGFHAAYLLAMTQFFGAARERGWRRRDRVAPCIVCVRSPCSA